MLPVRVAGHKNQTVVPFWGGWIMFPVPSIVLLYPAPAGGGSEEMLSNRHIEPSYSLSCVATASGGDTLSVADTKKVAMSIWIRLDERITVLLVAGLKRLSSAQNN